MFQVRAVRSADDPSLSHPPRATDVGAGAVGWGSLHATAHSAATKTAARGSIGPSQVWGRQRRSQTPVKRRSRGSLCGVTDAPPLPLSPHHIAVDHVADDPGDERVTPGFGHEPTLPFELVERIRQRRAGDARGPLERRAVHAPPEHRRGDEYRLRVARETTEVDSDR